MALVPAEFLCPHYLLTDYCLLPYCALVAASPVSCPELFFTHINGEQFATAVAVKFFGAGNLPHYFDEGGPFGAGALDGS